jgi:Mg2+/Co2+ transporter CorB
MLFARLFGSGGVAVAVATAVMTVTIVIFSEIAPKTAAIKRPDAIAIIVAPVMRWLVIILSPVTGVLHFIVRGILSLIGLNVTRDDRLFTAAEERRGRASP